MGTETGIVDSLYHLPTKENKLLFSISFTASKRKFAVYIFRLQQTNRGFLFL
jgi:hypothetical protein